MIKNLLDADENPPPGTKVIIEETIVEPLVSSHNSEMISSLEQTTDTENILEIHPAANDANTNSGDAPQNFQPVGETSKSEGENFVLPTTNDKTAQPKLEQTLFQTEYQPESTAETMRKSGLAYAAAITLFGAVVFMMVIGWFADLLLGSSPWGIVGGIVFGAIIGFIQFFRLTSQIHKD